MDTYSARRARGPRLKPLAGCLALALALGTGTIAAAPAMLRVERPALGGPPANWRPSGTPFDRIEQNAAIAMRYPALWPKLRAIPVVPAGSVPVTNCNDSGAGSLRDAVATAISGQTIDLTATGCSTITLTTGDIFIVQADLTLQGPGADALTIDGNHQYSFRHVSTLTGTFAVSDLAIVNGAKYLDDSTNADAVGGCIYSYTSVSLTNAYLKYCSAATTNASYQSGGGAIYARTGLSMFNSVIVLSSTGTPTSHGTGGAVYARGGTTTIEYSGIGLNYASYLGGGVVAVTGLTARHSSFLMNQALRYGGLVAGGNVSVENSTIASNHALYFGAGIFRGNAATSPQTLVNSTISGNSASHAVGGLKIDGYPARIVNSTIAFNTESNAANTRFGAGLFANAPVELESSIVSTNTLIDSINGPQADDIGGGSALSGANNMTQFVLPGQTAPPDTIYADPRLSSLGYNGGATATHALSPSSPALEAGNNAAGLATDQRGPGFARVIGANADIGAFEFNLDDLIFANGFD